MSVTSPRYLINSFVVLLTVANFAFGQTIIPPTHTDGNDPATEGFTFSAPNGAALTLEDDGGLWHMELQQVAGYTAAPAIMTGDGDFTFTAIGRVNSLSGNNSDLFTFAFLPGNPALERNWNFAFLSDLSGVWDRQAGKTGGVPNSSYTVPGDVTTEHAYQVTREGSVFTTYVDGVQAFTNLEGGGGPLDNAVFSVFNASSNSPTSDSHWRLWQFEEGIHVMETPDVTTFTWASSGAGDWEIPGNWSPSANGAPPDTSNDTAIFGNSIGSSSRTVFADSAITVNSIQLDNSIGGSYVVAGSGSINLAEIASESIAPTLNVSNQGSHQFQAIVNLQNDTTATIESGSTLTFTNSLNLNGNVFTKTGDGTIAINNILSTGGGTLNCFQGTCSGSGTIGGDVQNSGGTVSPGNSPGEMTINGDFAQNAASTLLIELGGTVSGSDHDLLQVDGQTTLSGILEVSLLNGFEPRAGDTFHILELASVTGDFDFVSLPPLADGLAWNDTLLLTDGSLLVVPEPATVLLLLLGVLATVRRHGEV